MSKYRALKRSQILMAIHHAETKLLLWKNADPRRAAVVRERAELFTVLREKDSEIARAWDNAHLFAKGQRKL